MLSSSGWGKNHPEITALFCHNDLVAVGALQACAELGLRVPDDIAIIGYDDIGLAALVSPALTTLRISAADIGTKTMQMLLEQIEVEGALLEARGVDPVARLLEDGGDRVSFSQVLR